MDLGRIDIHSNAAVVAIHDTPAAAPSPRTHPPTRNEVPSDSVTVHFPDISGADIERFAAITSQPISALEGAQVGQLVRTLVSSEAAANTAQVLSTVRALPGPDEARVELPEIPAMSESVQSSLDPSPHWHIILARMDAEWRLGQAEQRIGFSTQERMPGWEMKPETMVAIAQRIFNAGGLTNYTHAATLAQIVIDGTSWVPAVSDIDLAVPELALAEPYDSAAPLPSADRPRFLARFRALWLRAPLAILFLAWLLIGIGGLLCSLLWRALAQETWPDQLFGMGSDVWGIGFLVLVLLGFYARVRHVRF
jgi:hypothetical protein